MPRVALVAAAFAVWGLMSGLCAVGHVWHRADIEPTYTPDHGGWRQGEPEHTVEIASSWPKPTADHGGRRQGEPEHTVEIASSWLKPTGEREERTSTSLDLPSPAQYGRPPTRPSATHPHRQGPVTDKNAITRFVDKLQRSLERSTQFNSRADYHACLTPTGSKGCCTPVRLCVLPVFLDSLDMFLKYTCAIDNDHIGVCCPTEFVVNTNIPRRPDGTFVIATVLSPSPPRPTKNSTVHVVVTTSSSRPVYPVQHDDGLHSHNWGGGGSDNLLQKIFLRRKRHVSSTGSSGNRPGNKPTGRPQGGAGGGTTQRSTTSRPAGRPSSDPHSPMRRNPPRPPPPELQEIRTTCGTPAVHKRIIGGNEAEPNKWAWMAALMRRETGEHYCGGALISNRYVITAAHCTEGLKANNITIRLGAHNIQEPSVNVRDVEVSRIRQHPDFQKDTFMNDIAVLRLKRPVTFNEYIRPVCLPERPEETYFGKTAVATGWGTQKFGGPYSEILREVKLIVWNNTDCNQRFAQPITEVFLCAGAKKREGDACQGDSGGPLMVQTRSKQWTLIGVISWGIKCGEPGVPGIYTRTSHFLDYIYEHAVAQ
ncbi:hypothetical protein V5799_000309 [Amblyomma americanum]|uniref:Peptidase S1 domain-containing protein n=1 Tax=Amblyomma americanum TaxID=6943 RepID=A0AAQ4D3E9_AMBAM